MPVTALRAELAFTSAARREQVRRDVLNFLATRLTFGNLLVVATAELAMGANGLLIDVRMRNAHDADALIARIESFATGQRLPLVGSFIDIHDCTHDAADPAPCSGVTRRVW